MIHFYNKNREMIMLLHDFSFDNREEQVMKFSADISFAFYKASQIIEDFEWYIEMFLTDLQLLYNEKKNSARFIPIERQIEIYLKRCDEFGHIDVSIKLNDFDIDQTMYESSLIANYRIDQSFLPELIKEFSEVVKRAKHN